MPSLLPRFGCGRTGFNVCQRGRTSVLKYIVKRILSAIPVLLIVVFITFFLMRMLPGDVAVRILGRGCPAGGSGDPPGDPGPQRALLEPVCGLYQRPAPGGLGHLPVQQPACL